MLGSPFVASAEGVRNTFVINLTNKRNRDASFTIKLEDKEAHQLQAEDRTLTLTPLAEDSFTLSILAPIDSYKGTLDIHFIITADDGTTQSLPARFLGPGVRLYKESQQNK